MASLKSEKDVQSDIIKYCKQQGFKVDKIMKANSSGFPDLVICVKGLYFVCEVKAEKFVDDPEKQMSAWQHKHKDMTLDAKGQFICAASLEQFRSKLKYIVSIFEV